MPRKTVSFREIFADSGGAETFRAFAVFAVLILILVAIAGQLAFLGLNINVLHQRVDLIRLAALELARQLEDNGLDGSRLRENPDLLREMIREKLKQTPFVRQVEIRDRFDVRVVNVAAPTLTLSAHGPGGRLLPSSPPDRWIEIPLTRAGGQPAGKLQMGIANESLDEELQQLRSTLWFRIAVAAVAAVGVLVAALFYVLHLIRKNRNLERARQSAERASYVGLLASGLAHEIRNPLNAMNMNLQMLEEELRESHLESDQTELLDSTKSEIKRLERLVNNFLTYARPAKPRFEARDLNVVILEVTRLLEADFRQHGVDLRIDPEPLLPEVETDDTQLKQAFINLLVNARQVLKDGGTVTIKTRAGAKGEVVVEVTDNGPGIPPEVRERIFEVFYSSRGGGTGLGLPIARQIVERHGGTIEVDSVLDEGTTFRIRLPRHHVESAVAVAKERTV